MTNDTLDAARYRFLRQYLHRLSVDFDMTYDPHTEKGSSSFRSLNIADGRLWDSRTFSRLRIDERIDQLMAEEAAND